MLKKLVISGLILGTFMGIPSDADTERKHSPEYYRQVAQQEKWAQMHRDAEKFRAEVIQHSWKHVFPDGTVVYMSPDDMKEHLKRFSADLHDGWIDFNTGCFRGFVKAKINVNFWPYPVDVDGVVTIDNWTVMSINKMEIQMRRLDNGVYYRDDHPDY